MPDKTQEALKEPFDIAPPDPSEVLPAGSTATAFEDATPGGYNPASNLGEPTIDTRVTGLTSMGDFLSATKPKGVAGLAADAALEGAGLDYTESA